MEFGYSLFEILVEDTIYIFPKYLPINMYSTLECILIVYMYMYMCVCVQTL